MMDSNLIIFVLFNCKTFYKMSLGKIACDSIKKIFDKSC